MKKILKIAVCTHKDAYIPQVDSYIPIFVGSEFKDAIPEGLTPDNTGENISRLNHMYCELTGLYWLWKNQNADYYGLCHYRRYFSFRNPQYIYAIIEVVKHYIGHILFSMLNINKNGMYYPYSYMITSKKGLEASAICFENDFYHFVMDNPNYKVFALKPMDCGKMSNYIHFSTVAGKYHIDVLKTIVHNKYPEMSNAIDITLSSNKLYYANMTIMTKDIFDDYCKYIFGVLKDYNKYIIDNKYYTCNNEYSLSRVSGYMGELLTSSYITYLKNTGTRIKFLNQVQYSEV